MKAHGLGVHTPEEIEQFGKKDLQALSEMLGDKVGADFQSLALRDLFSIEVSKISYKT